MDAVITMPSQRSDILRQVAKAQAIPHMAQGTCFNRLFPRGVRKREEHAQAA